MGVNALEIAKSCAKARGVEDKPTNNEHELGVQASYAALASLASLGQFKANDSGDRLSLGGRRCEVEVSRTAQWAVVTLRELERFEVNRSRFGEGPEIRYRKGKAILREWLIGGPQGDYIVRDSAGVFPSKGFAELDDAVAHVAKEIGALIEV